MPIHHQSFLTNTLIWLGLGTLCFAWFSWLSVPKASMTGDRIEIVIPKSSDGHHYIDGELNGKPIRFLIDTGASYISIGSNQATQLGLTSGKPMRFETANGTVIGQLFENQSINISGLATPALTVGVMPKPADTALLGQNFLRHVELVQIDNKLILRGQKTSGEMALPATHRATIIALVGLALLLFAWLSSFLLKNSQR